MTRAAARHSARCLSQSLQMPNVITKLSRAKLAEMLEATQQEAQREVLPDYRNDSRFMTASQVAQYLGCSQKKVHAYGKQGVLNLIRVSPRCTFVAAEEVYALVRKLNLDAEPPDLSGYLTRAQTAAQLGVHPETVPRMVHDGRLTDTKLVNGRRLYAKADVETALAHLNFGRRMSVVEVSELTGLKYHAIWHLERHWLFPEANRDGRFRRSEVLAWWDAWRATQAPYEDPHRNDHLAQKMSYFRREEEQRLARLTELKRQIRADAEARKKAWDEERLKRSQRQ